MKTILCIDGHEGLRSLAGVVEDAGYRVLRAEDSRQALRMFVSQHVDGVLMRQHCCSEVEGHSMQRQMRRLAPEVPVLLFDGPAEGAQTALTWMDDYMGEKPARTNA